MSVWDDILARIETKVNRHSFYTWFRPTSFISEDVRTITVREPNPLFKDWLTKHYAGVIAEAMTEAQRPRLDAQLHRGALPDRDGCESWRGGSPRARNGRRPRGGRAPGLPGLNPRYTFDTFIVGSSNQFAHAASRAVAEAPSRSYNPLFIYGGVGLGKTHLMHAIGHYVLQHDRR